MLAGNRNSWMMVGLAVGGYAILLARARGRMPWRALAVLALGGILLSGALWQVHPGFRARVTATLALFSGSFEKADRASAWRLSIWRTAWRVFADHPVNGVGPRSFRNVYRRYAPPDDFWVRRGEIPTHPHQLALEVLAETGLLGGAGLVVFLVLVARLMIRAPPEDTLGRSFALAGLLAANPVNAHMAFYASYWASILWWLVLLALASSTLGTPGGRSRPATGALLARRPRRTSTSRRPSIPRKPAAHPTPTISRSASSGRSSRRGRCPPT